jgi:ATP/maltotriose-dependent transcriptional regulator MalT
MPTESNLRFEPIVHVDEAIWRQRVIDRLSSAAPATARLTLLSAPAGFGKTTALAQMASQARQAGSQVAWLNCDERDKDPAMFASSLGSALARCELGQSTSESPGTDLLTHRLGSLNIPLLVFIDDYEHASSAEVDSIVEQLARVVPANLCIVIASREAPHHHLTRLQLAGKVRLVDAELLRFNREEALGLLGDALPERACAQMVAYADGWPFALQLARLRANVAGGASDDLHVDAAHAKLPRRQIFDYLANEVLATLPPELLEFLGDIAVLERFDVAAANVLRERDDSQCFIRQLTRIRPVVVVDEQTWSARLHPLLRDYLLDTIEANQPGRIATLHLRAARHLAEKRRLHEAVAHAVAGGRLDVGADIIEQAGAFRLFADEGEVRVRLLMQQLPEATLRRRPRLRLLQLMRLALEGGPASTLQEFERLEQQICNADTGSNDPTRLDLEFVRCAMLLHASSHHLRFSPWSVLNESVRLARAHRAEDERLLACTIPFEIWFLHRYGPVERCERRIREMEAVSQNGAYTHNSPWIPMYHARTALAQGDLSQAENRIRQSLHQDVNFLNFRQGSLHQLVLTLLGQLAYHRGELDVAREHFGAVAATQVRLLEILNSSHVELALCEFALGHAEQAMAQLQEARQLAFEESLPQLEVLAGAAEVELLARQGDMSKLQAMAERIKLGELWNMAQEPFALPWVLVMALARAMFFERMARGQPTDACEVARALLCLAQRSGHRLSELCALLMAARASDAVGPGGRSHSETQNAMIRALTLGESSGSVQTFIDFGAELITLIRVWLASQPADASSGSAKWARHIVQVWEQRFRERAQGAVASLLTPREVDVLCELSKDHTTKVIAKNLMLSPETVKHYLKAIFAKLGVRSREEAILAARRRAIMP